MFKNAIEKVGQFTRPIHFISNIYGEKTARPGAATLFFVNDHGVAVTCKHVTALIKQSVNLMHQYQDFRKEKNALLDSGADKEMIQELVTKLGYDKPDSACQLLYQFVDCVDLQYVDVVEHPVYDLALLKMKGFTRLSYTSHAVFAKDSQELQPGVFLCRLGFPFPEFSNFKFDEATETIGWTNEMVKMVRFPIEGMVTRHFGDRTGKIVGVEMSTPGLKGQSGGPLFNADGLIYGMQSATHHYHLGFDMNNQELYSEGRKIKITNQPMLHVGSCVHVDVIKQFLREQQVVFYEA
jgi:hypothetical protein